MGLFGFGKKEATKAPSNARIKVLGTGCRKCENLEANVREALKRMDKDIEVAHVNDVAQIASFGVMQTPALVVDGTLVSSGKVHSVEELMELLP